METLWKVLSSLVVLFLFGLCNGLPINLENSGPDPHTQFLTGLVAVLLAICSVVLLAGCLCCQRNNGFKEFRDSPVASSTTIIGSNQDHGHVNPIANSSSEFTIFTPISPPHHNNNVFLANQRIVSCSQEEYKDGDIDASLWFDGSEKDFPRTKLKYIRELGKGWFGRVVEGTAQNISEDPGDPEWTPVVVRILEASATSRERLLFLNDAAIYKCGYHPHILRILGRSLDTVPLLLLQEYCSQGDLKKYLRMCKSSQDKLVAEEMPLRWCYQLTLALKFLHDQKLTHPDLAARNCQVSEDLSLKLGDYGLSASYYPEDYYQGSPGVPLRWCAPEIIAYTSTTIQTTPTTVESNIWALGVTMWEMLEWGEQPYSDLTDDEVISHVLGTAKIRLTRPTYHLIYTDYMYKIMQSCWYNSESRITVSQIELMVTDLMHVYKNTKISLDLNSDIPHEGEPISLEEFDMRWNALKPNSPPARDSDVLEQLQQNQSREKQDRAQKSASMNNLHGSLDNLLDTRQFDPMESWLENVASDVSDMSFVRGLSEAITDLDNAIAMQNISSSPEFGKAKVTVGGQFTSSESETEDENWRKKIERGAYTEKVRQKSRSVADLMVLTHIDYSESDSETLPSLDYSKANQRVRYLKSVDNQKKFGSEGNLIHVHDNTFQEELKKLQEERRDSLLFVPDKFSECSFSEEKAAAAATSTMPSSLSNNRLNNLENSPVKKLIEKLNSPSEMVPPQQVYNVFNVRVQHLNVSGTVCDKIGETVDRNVNAISSDSVEKEENAFSAICDRQLESKVLEQNMLILPSSDNQNKLFSVDNSENQNIEHRECPSHIKPFYNPFVNAENSTNSSYDGCIKKVEGQNVIFSKNCIEEETYPCKKVSNGILDSAYKINSTNEKNNEIISNILEKTPYGKVKEEKPMISNAPTSPNQYSNILQRKELSTENDTMKQNNFEVKIEILNEQNSTLNTHKNYNIMPNNLNNEISSSKEILATSKENNKNVKLKVPKLSEIIQRNAIDYKVHHHHSGSNDKTSVISKNEENEKLIHQDIVDKDSGLNTPENSASLEKLYDDNEEILDIGSFDSDRSNETNTNKGILLTELSNEEEHSSKGKSDEVPVLGYFREETKEIGEEDEISKMIDYCVKKEAKLVCDLFLAHERSNYFADANDTLVIDSKTVELDSEVNKKSLSCENVSSVIKKYSFLTYDYKNDMRNFIESEVYHTSILLDYAVLPSKLDNDIMQDVDVNTNALMTKDDRCKYDRNSAIENVVLSNQRLLNNKTSENRSIISYTGSKAVSLNEETNNSSRINTDDKVPDKFDFIQGRNFSQRENLGSTSSSELLDKDEQTIENQTEVKTIPFDERLKPAVTDFEKLDNNHTVEKDPYQNMGSTIYEVLSVQSDTAVNNLPDLTEIKDCQVQSTVLENQINAKTVHQLFNGNDNNHDDINRKFDFDIVKVVENFNLAALEKEIRCEPVILEKLMAKFDNNEANENTALDDESSTQEKLTIIDIIQNSSSTVNEEKNQEFMSKPDENEAICENVKISQTRSFLNNEIKYSSIYPIITNTYINDPDHTIFKSTKTYEEVTISNTPNKLQEFTFKDIVTGKEDISSKEENITENIIIKDSVLNDSAERIAEITENGSTMQQNDLRNTIDAVVPLDFNTNCDLNLSRFAQFEFMEDEQLLPHISKKKELAVHNSETNACNLDQPSVILIDEVMNDNDATLKVHPKLHEQTPLKEHDDIMNNETNPQVTGLDTENDANVVVGNVDYIDKADVSSENAFLVTFDESEQNIQELNTSQSNTPTPLCSVNKLQGDIFGSNNNQSSKVPSLVSFATITQTAVFLNMEISSYSKVDSELIICSSVQPSNEFGEVVTDENKVDHSLDNTQSTTFPILGSEVVSEIQELPVVAQEEFERLKDTSLVKLVNIESSSQIEETCKEIGDNQNIVDIASNNASKCDMATEEIKENEHSAKIIQPLAISTDEKELFTLIDCEPKSQEDKPQQTGFQCEDVSKNFHEDNNENALIRELKAKIKDTAIFLNNEIVNYHNFEKRMKIESAHTDNQLNKDLSVSEIDSENILKNETKESTELDDKLNNCSISNFSELEHLTDKADYNEVTTTEVVENSEIDTNHKIAETFTFLKHEIENYVGNERKVDFDLSDTQEKISLNSLTHISTFTSTPFANRRPTDSAVILGASEDYSIDYYSGLKTSVDPEENADLQFSSNFVRPNNTNDLYSLETWDNFLGRSFDEQESAAVDFNDFSEEPHSLLFLECDNNSANQTNELKMTKVLDETYDPGNVPPTNETFTKECEENPNATFDVSTNKTRDQIEIDPWEATSSNRSNGGWFLHPQSTTTDTPTKSQETTSTTAPEESYVGFSMDDEIMAAIRNELLTKLPHAQRASSDHQIEENCEEMDSAERNEVFLRYNVYNTPLSPIPEESCDSEAGSGRVTPKRINDTSDEDGDSSDWSLQEDNNSSNARTEEIISPRIPESPTRCRTDQYRHTPSQDSCCSNDTLFNVEELNAGLNDKMLLEPVLNQLSNALDSMEDEISESKYDDCDIDTTLVSNERQLMDHSSKETQRDPSQLPIIKTEHSYILDFLDNERYGEMNMSLDAGEEVSSTSDIYLTVSENTFSFGQNVAPLNSPEDRPWKEIQASFRDCDEVELSKINSEEPGIPQEHSADNSLNDTKLSLNAMDADSTTVQIQDTVDLKDPPSFVNEFGETEELDDCLISDEDIDKVLREDMESEILNNLQEEIHSNQSNSDFPLDERMYVNVQPDLVPANDLHGNKVNLVTAESDGLNNDEMYANLSSSEGQITMENKDDVHSPDDAVYVNLTRTEEGNVASHLNTTTDNTIYVNMTKTESGESFNTEDSSSYSDSIDTFNRHQPALGYENLKASCCDDEDLYSKIDDPDDSDKFSRFDDLFGPLTDIRFSGPGSSSQMMTTSFSESNDLGDDQEWDSGSDTRSSSSGEFIWKEGEHEASVKALRAPPQLENFDYATAMENIQEETAESNKGISSSGSSSGSEGEDECPEFVPSAWDKYATPTKSALRSPEKTLQRSKEEKAQDQRTSKEKKSKGVWFKKQKYHCVYEYPREPESPVLQSYDLWKPAPDYATLSDWDLDTDPYLSVALSSSEILDKQPTRDNLPKNSYHLNTFTDINVDPRMLNDEDFFVSSSSKPFDMLTGLTSQFFPGKQYPNDRWIENVNVTPDSGVEDITTPATFVDEIDGSYNNKKKSNSQLTEVQSLKVLAATAAERSGTRRELGGLRHTRSKLKLDLPPSPSAFTSNRTFSLDTTAEEIVTRQVPTFTTFGKSRFLVQHVDTPPDSGRADKNVSFEALPHKKPQTLLVDTSDWKHQKKECQKIESVRGEASLLDSADEDSGIESCTLDRRRFNI